MPAHRPVSIRRAPDTASGSRHWTDDALCRGAAEPEEFFPNGGGAAGQQQVDDAKTFCTACPVRMTCALYALTEGHDSGVWGALDEIQRRRIHRNHPADLKQAVRNEWAARSANPHFEAYVKRTEQEEDGHVRWLVKTNSVVVLGQSYTPAQLALLIARGRPAHGHVKATCGRTGCVAPEHVADSIVHWDRSRDEYKATA